MITIYIIGVATVAIILLNYHLLNHIKRQQETLDMLMEFNQVNYILTKFQNDALDIVLWKTMTDLYHSKAAAVSNENYEMAEQYKNAIHAIENMMTYYRQNLKQDVPSED